MDGFLRRRNIHEEANGVDALLDQGDLEFNACRLNISGNTINIKNSPNISDAYNVKRYVNVTDLSSNVTTGTGMTTDISNKRSGVVIPAGADCVFKATPHSGTHCSASYQYIAVLLRDTTTNTIKRIGAFGNNCPTNTASWTQGSDIEIGCIAVEYSHFQYSNSPTANQGVFDLSLTVGGVEWL